jgi:hypothetical protein
MKKVIAVIVASIVASSLFAATVTTLTTDLVNSTVYVQTSIKQVTGGDTTTVYVETQEPNTDKEGKCTFEIGKGTVVEGDYASVDTTKGEFIYVIGINENGSDVYTSVKTIAESDIKSNDLSKVDALEARIAKLEAMIIKMEAENSDRDILINRIKEKVIFILTCMDQPSDF